MTRRPGLTLMEVLVTLFILAFGVMAILTLFPLAASQMFVAVREDRSALGANAADGFMRSYWKSEVVDRSRDTQPINEPFFQALDDGGGQPLALATESSYPVVIDPMGYVARSGGGQTRFGDGGGTGVPRRTLNVIAGNQHALRVCSLMDGFGYTEHGQPTADREMRYNWLWVVQRPLNSSRFAASLTVVVFDNRPHLYAPSGAETVVGGVTVTPGSTAVTLPGNRDVKPGGWVMDATVGGRIRQAHFYQVVSVTPSGGNTVVELQNPLRTPSDNNTAPYTGTFVLLRGVSGVSVRPPLTAE